MYFRHKLLVREGFKTGIMISVRDFNRNNNSGRGRSFGDKRQFNNRGFDRPRPTMYPATCSKCGKECEVPFRPTGEKPVLCRDCFRENNGGEARRPEERSFSRPQNAPSQNNEYKAQLDALTSKVDKILEILTAAMSTEETQEEVLEPEEVPTPEKKKTTKKAL